MRFDLQWPVVFPIYPIPFLLFTLLLLSPTAFAGKVISSADGQAEISQQRYLKARQLLQQRQYRQAAGLLIKAADQGNRLAQYRLGLLFARGAGVDKNLVKAREWLQKAALQGHPKAQFYLGQMYLFGDGGAKEPVTAATWFWLATSLGDRYAKDSLRVMTAKLSARQFEQAKRRARELWSRIPHDMKVSKATLMH
ncbi:MAG TPA: sel1 repeat family protein [Gammaproteobacteria bacterium]|nr:sel1 repeat family protein [Gammaproteobacteria bacterium]